MALFGMHFDVQKQRDFILSHGSQVAIFPAVACPCLTAEKQTDPNCPGCKGVGRYYPPGLGYATTVLPSDEDARRVFFDPGSWTPGTLKVRILPEIRLGDRDKVRAVDQKDTYNDEVLIKGLDDSVRFSGGVSIEAVVDLSTVYRPGIDYILQPPHTIMWVPGGNAPAFMGQYSVRYQAYVEYLVVGDSPRLRIEHRTPQCSEVVLERLDKIQRDL